MAKIIVDENKGMFGVNISKLKGNKSKSTSSKKVVKSTKSTKEKKSK